MIDTMDHITFNLHLSGLCNMKCIDCFGRFKYNVPISIDEWHRVVDSIDEFTRHIPVRRISLVGGEPLLYPFLGDLIKYISSKDMDISVVTNGSLLTSELVEQMRGRVSMIGISIDSLSEATNRRIGRSIAGVVMTENRYLQIANIISSSGIKLKINTVVSKLNFEEDLREFIESVEVFRWKAMKMIHVKGENDQAAKLVVSDKEFKDFCARNSDGCPLIVEDEEIMKNSYIMISPDGRFFDSSQGRYNLSEPILKAGIERAFGQIHFDRESFRKKTEV